MVDTAIKREEEIRDLTTQIDELRRQDEGEIIFRENSPARRQTTIYSMRDGCPLPMPEYMAKQALRKRENGQYMFTADKGRAPEYRLGQIKCFLHKDSADQVFLAKIGLSGEANYCRKATLANEHSKRMHGMHRHKEEWEAYQAFLNDHKEREAIVRQERQLDATLALAGKAAGVETPVAVADAPSAATEALVGIAEGLVAPTNAEIVDKVFALESCPLDGCDYAPAPGPAEGVAKALDLHRRTEHEA